MAQFQLLELYKGHRDRLVSALCPVFGIGIQEVVKGCSPTFATLASYKHTRASLRRMLLMPSLQEETSRDGSWVSLTLSRPPQGLPLSAMTSRRPLKTRLGSRTSMMDRVSVT